MHRQAQSTHEQHETPAPAPALAWIKAFSELALRALHEEQDEPLRIRYENALIDQARQLQQAGLFEIMQIRHPALRAMIEDGL